MSSTVDRPIGRPVDRIGHLLSRGAAPPPLLVCCREGRPRNVTLPAALGGHPGRCLASWRDAGGSERGGISDGHTKTQQHQHKIVGAP
jgi:hypothetical protein